MYIVDLNKYNDKVVLQNPKSRLLKICCSSQRYQVISLPSDFVFCILLGFSKRLEFKFAFAVDNRKNKIYEQTKMS